MTARERRTGGRSDEGSALVPLHGLKVLIEALGRTFGSACEFVLHDLGDLNHSIVAIANGHVTGRKVGDGVTAYFGSSTGFLADLPEDGVAASADDAQFVTTTGREGKRLKSATVYIRDADHKVVGAVCVNIDLSGPMAGLHFLQQLVAPSQDDRPARQRPVMEVLDHLLEEAFRYVGATPATMTREEKIEVIRILRERGAFMIKGAALRIARALHVSRHTVYNYLDELKVRQV